MADLNLLCNFVNIYIYIYVPAKLHKYVNDYIPRRHNDSINIQIVYMATIQDFLRTVMTK